MDAENVIPVEQPATVHQVDVERPQPVTFDAESGKEVAEQPETETQDAETREETAERDEKGRFKGVQPRIDELTRARREAEREAAYWRQLATKGAPAEAAPEKPTPDKFADYGEYVEALTDWKAEQAVSKRMEHDSNRKVVETRVHTFQERQSQVRTAIPDYDAVVGSSQAPITEHVGDILVDSDLGPQLAYHFAKNPEVLLRLNDMSPTQAAREIGRIEAGLSSKPASAPAAPVKKVSQAPVPANTSATQGRSTTPTLANASMEEYMAQRRAQGARWAR